MYPCQLVKYHSILHATDSKLNIFKTAYSCCIARLSEIVIHLFSMLFFAYTHGSNISSAILRDLYNI